MKNPETDGGTRGNRGLAGVAASALLSMVACFFALWENWGMPRTEIAKCVATSAMLGLFLGSHSPLKRFLLRACARQRNT